MVTLENTDGGSPNGCQSDERSSTPVEMFLPNVLPWIKEPRHPICFRVHTGKIWPLMFVAPQTGPRQIFQNGGASVLFCADMIALEPQLGKALGKMALLTAKSSALPQP